MIDQTSRSSSNYERVLKALSENNLFGQPYEVIKFNDEPKIPTYICLPNKRARKEYKCDGAFGQGSSLDANLAKVKAAAEFLERLAIFNPDKSAFTKGCFDETRHVDPSLFVHDTALAREIHDGGNANLKKADYYWSRTFDHIRKKATFVPAQAVYISKIFDRETALIPEQITTGAALGSTYEQAYQNGLMEDIERDAFMIAYHNKKRIMRIVDFPRKISELVDYLKRYCLEVYVFDITTNLLVASFMAIVVDRSGIGPAISVGLRSGFNYEDAITGAILEAVQTRRFSRLMKEMNNEFKLPGASELGSTMSRYYFWYPKEMIKYLGFWLDHSDTIPYKRLPKYASSVREVEHTMKQKDYHIFSVDMTIKEVKSMGFKIIKVLVPELHPLFLSEKARAMYSIHAGFMVPKKGLKPHPFA